VKLSGSLIALAANIALMPDANGTVFKTVGGRESAIKILSAAAHKLAEIERVEAQPEATSSTGWDPR
jgi:hypothetical protein